MKNFYEFYRVLKAKTLLEQEMPDAMAANAGAAVPPPQGGSVPPAAPVAPPAEAGADEVPNEDDASGDEAEMGSEDDMSNASPSEGELDTSEVSASIEALENMVDNFKSQDEEKGTQYETLVKQLKSLVGSLTGEEEETEEDGEGEDEEAPPDSGDGQNPIPSGGAPEDPESFGDMGSPSPDAAPGAGTMQGAAPTAPMA